MILLVGLTIGVLIGWSLHTMYLRAIWGGIQRGKRAMRGAQGRKRRRR